MMSKGSEHTMGALAPASCTAIDCRGAAPDV
jgi:hypothetical protein